VCCAALAPAANVRAQSESELLEIIQRLEARVEQLETREADEDAQPAHEAKALEFEEKDFEDGGNWADRVRISGSANTGWFGGESDSVTSNDAFQIWDARFFIEAELARDVNLGEINLVRDVGFVFEWDLVRLGSLQNRVGELYVDFQGIAEQNWANLQVGRFQIPVGENYLRFSQGYADNPFISNTVGGPWWWDEGLRTYGRIGKLGWVASTSDGETPFNSDPNTDKQFTLKLYTDPTPWLHISASGLRSGAMGSGNTPASGALWLGETWARAFGAGTTVPNFQDGVVIADGPNRLDDGWFAGGDVILNFQDVARLWLGGGWYGIDSSGGSLYDRNLYYWIAELVVEGAALAPVLAPFYVGSRANGLGTYDSNEGYILDSRQSGNLGYNANSLAAYTTVLGWRIADGVTLRAEYSINDVGVVNGVTDEIRENAKDQDTYAIEIGVDF
jgi:hypothetical protein